MKDNKRNRQNRIITTTVFFMILVAMMVSFINGGNVNEEKADGMIAATVTTAETATEDYWHLTRISVPQAQLITTGSEEVIIAVLDTGINDSHPVLEGRIIAEVNFTDSADLTDHNGHGTHVAGAIAGGITEMGIINGIAYDCSLLNVKVANDDGTVNVEAVIEGIRWAADNGADIINISLTIYHDNQALEDATDYAWEKGALVIAAAGNNRSDGNAYPAMYPNAVAVAATDTNDELAAYSNYGEWTDISAPGTAITSSVLEKGYAAMTGTSMAAALVSGEAALIFGLAVDMNQDGRVNDEVKTALLEGTVTVDGEQETAINMANAVEAIDTVFAEQYQYIMQAYTYR